MKTATITFHAPNNNGSFFQAFALQQVLKNELQVENQIIDFRSEKQINQYSVLRPIHSKNDIAKNVVSLTHYKSIKEHNLRFERMREHYLVMTKRCSTVEEVQKLAGKYDLIIAGSDQIWNTTAPDFSEAYLLPKVPVKKIAYAVSLGSRSANTKLAEYKDYLDAFAEISTRETSAKRILEKILKKDINIVLDPTFLLEKKDYEKIVSNQNPIVEGDYIFFYSISYPSDVLNVVRSVAKRSGMKVVTVFTSFHTIMCERYGIEVRYNAGPEEFLNLISNAKMILTNSFHGTAFSIIYEKSFYHICETKNGRLQQDDRIDGIIEALGIENCNVGINNIPSTIPRFKYEDIDWKLIKLREESMKILRNYIE